MKIVKTKDALLKELENLKKFDEKLSFIPTMGNLHEGHLKLVEVGKRLAKYTVVSIFVNKKQFGENEDFEAYPRTEEADIKKLEEAGVNLLYIPKSEGEIFGSEFSLKLDTPLLTNCLCGVVRPNFFGGVLAVVMKLFLQIKPDFGIFGKKDYQQFLVVSALAASLDIGIEVIGVETRREENGLALSSRNNYFSFEQRQGLGFIYTSLMNAKKKLEDGENLEKILAEEVKILEAKGIEKLDYLEVRSAKGLKLLSTFERSAKPILFFAGWINSVRLIDNIELF